MQHTDDDDDDRNIILSFQRQNSINGRRLKIKRQSNFETCLSTMMYYVLGYDTHWLPNDDGGCGGLLKSTCISFLLHHPLRSLLLLLLLLSNRNLPSPMAVMMLGSDTLHWWCRMNITAADGSSSWGNTHTHTHTHIFSPLFLSTSGGELLFFLRCSSLEASKYRNLISSPMNRRSKKGFISIFCS